MGQILQTSPVRNEQAKMQHRFSLKFRGLDKVLDRAKNSPLAPVRDRYNNLASAFEKPGWTVEQTLELSLLSVTVPAIEIAREDVHRFNDSFKMLTKFEPVPELQVVFYDYIKGSASAIIGAWQALSGEKQSGAISLKEQYTLPLAELYSYAGNAPADPDPQPADVFALVNLAPASIDLGEMSYENGAVRRVTCNFLVDNVYPVLANGNAGTA